MNNRLRIVTCALCMITCCTVWCQTKLNDAQKQQIVAQIERTATSMQTMECKFTQTRSMKMLRNKMKSEGVMYFRRANKLRWQYTTPYDYTFIINNGKATVKSKKKNETIDVNKNKIFGQITDIIMACITGGSLSNSSYFDVELYKQSDGTVFANMKPLKKEIRQVYSLITLHFNAALTMVTQVEMTEKSGDKTVVSLHNMKINGKIDDKVFSID